MASTRDWDAASYHRVSVPHEEWAKSILDRLELRGDEVVLDAGCGSGRVTSMLIERLPEGRVIAVDGSASMVEQVGSVLRDQDEAMVADLIELELGEPVDVVFSSAVFHWVLDHDALFRSLRRALKPGGRLAAQNGGAGNIARLKRSSEVVAGREPYAPYFEGFGQPWNYAAPEETEERLERAGFVEARCWLQPWDVVPPEPHEFLRTVCLGPHVDRLPESLRDSYVADVLALEDEPLVLGYVRLNIEARAGDAGRSAPRASA
jgi:trans-aconitate 2-methyltransferase